MVKLKNINEILCKIKTVYNSMIDWDSKLLDALWTYRIAHRITTKFTPFPLVYDQEAFLLVELNLPSLRIASDDVQEIITVLECLDGIRNQAYLSIATTQKWRKTYYDSERKPKSLIAISLVFLYDNRFQNLLGKFNYTE